MADIRDNDPGHLSADEELKLAENAVEAQREREIAEMEAAGAEVRAAAAKNQADANANIANKARVEAATNARERARAESLAESSRAEAENTKIAFYLLVGIVLAVALLLGAWTYGFDRADDDAVVQTPPVVVPQPQQDQPDNVIVTPPPAPAPVQPVAPTAPAETNTNITIDPDGNREGVDAGGDGATSGTINP